LVQEACIHHIEIYRTWSLDFVIAKRVLASVLLIIMAIDAQYMFIGWALKSPLLRALGAAA